MTILCVFGLATGCFRYGDDVEPVLVDAKDAAQAVDFGKVKLDYLIRLEKQIGNKAATESLNVFTPIDAKKVLGLFCRGGKPVRGIKDSVTYILPKPPAGIPLDTAKKVMDHEIIVMNRIIESFYSRLASPIKHIRNRLMGRDVDGQSAWHPPGGYPLVMKPGEATEKGAGKGLFGGLFAELFSAPPAATAQTLIERFKSNVASEHVGNGEPVVVRTRDGDHSSWLVTTTDPNNSYRTATYTENNAQRTRNDIAPEGLLEITPIELLAIAEEYVLIVSERERASWAKVASARRYGDIEASLKTNIPSGAPLAPSKLLADRSAIMDEYLIANTAIAESTTDDGQVYSFTLSLNTEPLCRLARPIDSLFSK